MKKIILAFGFLLTLLPVSASACVNGPEGTDSNCEETEVVETEQPRFVAGTDLNTDGKRQNSSFFAATNIDDNSLITGPAFMAGNQLRLNGKYEYGFHAGNGVTINGTYDKDLFAAGNVVTVSEEAKVGRDVFIAGNVVTIRTNISGDLFVAANKLVLDNVEITGDVNVIVNIIEYKGEVKIGKTLTRNSNAKITGEAASLGKEETYVINEPSNNPMMALVATLFGIASKLVVMIIFMLIGKNFFKALVDLIGSATSNDMTKIVLIGLGLFIAVPLAAVALLFTVIGLPAALIALGGYAILMYLGSIVTAIYLNERFFKIKNGMIGALIGIVLLGVLSTAPYLGSLVSLIASVFGFGLTVRVLFWKN